MFKNKLIDSQLRSMYLPLLMLTQSDCIMNLQLIYERQSNVGRRNWDIFAWCPLTSAELALYLEYDCFFI